MHVLGYETTPLRVSSSPVQIILSQRHLSFLETTFTKGFASRALLQLRFPSLFFAQMRRTVSNGKCRILNYSSFNLLRWNDVPRTSRTFCPKIATFSQFQIYSNVIQAKQMTSLLPVNNFYPVISYRRVQKKKKATNYCIRFGHSLWSAISSQRKGLTSCAGITCHARR